MNTGRRITSRITTKFGGGLFWNRPRNASSSLQSSTLKSFFSSKSQEAQFPCLDSLEERTLTFQNNGGFNPFPKLPRGCKIFKSEKSLHLDYGGTLPQIEVAYETWGVLNQEKSNAVLLFTGLSASSHAKSHSLDQTPGWWEKFIGPKADLNTEKFFVICANVLGGCYGTTGPSSWYDGNRYATNFPMISIFDMIRAQFMLLDHLGITRLHAAVGSSMGGQQSLASAYLFKERVARVISISAGAKSRPYSIALRHTQRQALMSDPLWNKGNYYDSVPPHVGMKLARQIATIRLQAMDLFDMSYSKLLQASQTRRRNGVELMSGENSISSTDSKDPSNNHSKEEEKADLVAGLEQITQPTLVLGVKSDILFPVWQQEELAECLREGGNDQVTYYELSGDYGHDTFLIDSVNVGAAVKGHLEHV